MSKNEQRSRGKREKRDFANGAAELMRMAEQFLKNSCHSCFFSPPSCIIGIHTKEEFFYAGTTD